MISEELFDAVMEDIILLHLVGIRVVLVHGGGPEINDMLKKSEKSRGLSKACDIRTARRWRSFRAFMR